MTMTANLPATRPAAAALPAPDQVVHRSVRHLLVSVGALAAAATAGTGVSGLVMQQYVELSKWLLIVAGLLATFTLLVLADVAREGRHWRYAEDVD